MIIVEIDGLSIYLDPSVLLRDRTTGAAVLAVNAGTLETLYNGSQVDTIRSREAKPCTTRTSQSRVISVFLVCLVPEAPACGRCTFGSTIRAAACARAASPGLLCSSTKLLRGCVRAKVQSRSCRTDTTSVASSHVFDVKIEVSL